MKRKFWIVLAAFLFFVGTALTQGATDSYLIKAKKIYTVSKGVIEDGMILVEKGKIAKNR